MAKVTAHNPGGGTGSSQGSMDAADQVYDGMVRMEHFFEENWRQLVLFGGGVLLLGCLIVGAREYQRSRSKAGAAAFYEATAAESDSARREALASVGEEYSGTGAALQATFQVAQSAYEAEEYEQAAAMYRDIIDTYVASDLRAAAQVALAGILETQGAAAEGEKLYRAVLSDSPDSYVAPQARLALGRLAESGGRTDEAIEHYQAIVDAASGIAWTEPAQKRLAALRPATSGLPASSPPAPETPAE